MTRGKRAMKKLEWRDKVFNPCKQKMATRDSSAYCLYCRRRGSGNCCNYENCPDKYPTGEEGG